MASHVGRSIPELRPRHHKAGADCSQFRELETSVEAFKKAAESSALGVWMDKNKKVLYVVGAALVVGTAGVLYVTKTGGSLVNKAVDPFRTRIAQAYLMVRDSSSCSYQLYTTLDPSAPAHSLP